VVKKLLPTLALLLGFSPALAQTPNPVTPRACTNTAIATGGTAVTVVSGPVNGAFVYNPPNAASQGIGAAENLYIDMVGTPGSTDAAGNGTTATIVPGQNYQIPMLAPNVLVKMNAATSGHKVTGVCF